MLEKKAIADRAAFDSAGDRVFEEDANLHSAAVSGATDALLSATAADMSIFSEQISNGASLNAEDDDIVLDFSDVSSASSITGNDEAKNMYEDFMVDLLDFDNSGNVSATELHDVASDMTSNGIETIGGYQSFVANINEQISKIKEGFSNSDILNVSDDGVVSTAVEGFSTSRNSDGRYTNGSVSHIIANHYEDVELYSDEYDELAEALRLANPDIATDDDHFILKLHTGDEVVLPERITSDEEPTYYRVGSDFYTTDESGNVVKTDAPEGQEAAIVPPEIVEEVENDAETHGISKEEYDEIRANLDSYPEAGEVLEYNHLNGQTVTFTTTNDGKEMMLYDKDGNQIERTLTSDDGTTTLHELYDSSDGSYNYSIKEYGSYDDYLSGYYLAVSTDTTYKLDGDQVEVGENGAYKMFAGTPSIDQITSMTQNITMNENNANQYVATRNDDGTFSFKMNEMTNNSWEYGIVQQDASWLPAGMAASLGVELPEGGDTEEGATGTEFTGKVVDFNIDDRIDEISSMEFSDYSALVDSIEESTDSDYIRSLDDTQRNQYIAAVEYADMLGELISANDEYGINYVNSGYYNSLIQIDGHSPERALEALQAIEYGHASRLELEGAVEESVIDIDNITHAQNFLLTSEDGYNLEYNMLIANNALYHAQNYSYSEQIRYNIGDDEADLNQPFTLLQQHADTVRQANEEFANYLVNESGQYDITLSGDTESDSHKNRTELLNLLAVKYDTYMNDVYGGWFGAPQEEQDMRAKMETYMVGLRDNTIDSASYGEIEDLILSLN